MRSNSHRNSSSVPSDEDYHGLGFRVQGLKMCQALLPPSVEI